MHKDYDGEKAYLEHAKSIAQQQLIQLRALAQKGKDTILAQKQEMREGAQHGFSSSLWSGDGFEQLVEMSQYAAQAAETLSKYEFDVKKIDLLEKFLDNPYFARIDFKFDEDEDEIEKIYIGRHSVMDEKRYEMVVYDWRSPISSMFYRFGLGKAFYEAPAGKISGEISRKRQYEIKKGELEYFFDTDMQILDEFLRKMLTQNASPQMKSIVETIQRDQDLIIRNMDSDLLMVQGVAGSGKTSVALHRVAYLMYHGLTGRLASQNILIISPNSLFEEYIANVLPELGEENIASFLIDELLRKILKKKIQPKSKLYETLINNSGKEWTAMMKESLVFKMGSVFVQMLSRLSLPKKSSHKDVQEIYRRCFAEEKLFLKLAEGLKLPKNWDAIRQFTLEGLEYNPINFDDASALAYLYLKSNSYDKYRHIKQVVIDEAQDYYPIHFEIFKRLFPNAQFTILGDVNQTIEKQEALSFYDEVKEILEMKKSALVTMDKSFRCAHEILAFSARFIDTEVKSFSRHSDAPQLYQGRDENDFSALLKEISLCREKGYQSVGILCKSEKDAARLYKKLAQQSELNELFLIKNQSGCNLIGTLILPVYLAKGLEFDAALLWDVDDKRYSTPEDRQLLYIACTRALHHLSLFYHGEKSKLL